MRGLTPEKLLAAAQEVHDRWPNARLHRNAVGNLAVMGDRDEFLGWIELSTGDVQATGWVEGHDAHL